MLFQVDALIETLETDNEEEFETNKEAPLIPFSSVSDSEDQGNMNNNVTTNGSQISSASSSRRYRQITSTNKRKKANIEQKKQELVDLAHKVLSNNDDTDEEYHIAGKRIGYQLKAVEDRQRNIAEKLISDVMFYAKMGRLTEDTSINIPR